MSQSQWQIARQRDYRGGEVQSLLPEAVGRNQLLKMENALIFPNGYVTAFFQTDTQIVQNASLGLSLALNPDGTYTFHSTPGADTIVTGTLDTSRNTPLNVNTGTTHAVPGANIGCVCKAVSFLGKIYAPNATGGILDLTDFTLIAIPGKNVRKLYVYTNRLWGVCDDGTLIISNNGDATTWDALNVTYLPNQEKIIDFTPVQGGAIVYSQTSIYAMYGSSYLDLSFALLLDRQVFTSGPVNIDGTVYIVGSRGVYAANLNGAAAIPHNQSPYFQSIFPIISKTPYLMDALQGVYLQHFEAILWLWDSSLGGAQGFVFYPKANAYSKVNQLLNPASPYLLAMNDANTDFIIGGSIAGAFNKSTYPSRSTTSPRTSVLRTRQEDCDSPRSKVWRELSIQTSKVAFGVTIDAYQDDNAQPVNICTNEVMVPGRNIFWLDIPRSQSLSLDITVDNSLVNYLTDDQIQELTDELGDQLFASQTPGQFTFEEFRIKYREAGPPL